MCSEGETERERARVKRKGAWGRERELGRSARTNHGRRPCRTTNSRSERRQREGDAVPPDSPGAEQRLVAEREPVTTSAAVSIEPR